MAVGYKLLITEDGLKSPLSFNFDEICQDIPAKNLSKILTIDVKKAYRDNSNYSWGVFYVFKRYIENGNIFLFYLKYTFIKDLYNRDGYKASIVVLKNALVNPNYVYDLFEIFDNYFDNNQYININTNNIESGVTSFYEDYKNDKAYILIPEKEKITRETIEKIILLTYSHSIVKEFNTVYIINNEHLAILFDKNITDICHISIEEYEPNFPYLLPYNLANLKDFADDTISDKLKNEDNEDSVDDSQEETNVNLEVDKLAKPIINPPNEVPVNGNKNNFTAFEKEIKKLLSKSYSLSIKEILILIFFNLIFFLLISLYYNIRINNIQNQYGSADRNSEVQHPYKEHEKKTPEQLDISPKYHAEENVQNAQMYSQGIINCLSDVDTYLFNNSYISDRHKILYNKLIFYHNISNLNIEQNRAINERMQLMRNLKNYNN